MLGNKSAPAKAAGSSTLVSRDTVINGNIEFSGCLDVEGLVQGNIVARGGKDAVVRVLAKGRVEGEIRAPGVIIDGSVKGDVHATRKLQLASRAQVVGSVFYVEAEMSAGAQVNGQFKHVGEAPVRAPEDLPAKLVSKENAAPPGLAGQRQT